MADVTHISQRSIAGGSPAGLTAVPSIDDLAAHPQRAVELSPALAADLLGTCEAELVRLHRVRDALLIRAVAGSAAPSPAAAGDVCDSIEEAARLIGRTPHFIYRNHSSLPFVIQEGRGRRLRFSRSAIERYLTTHRSA